MRRPGTVLDEQVDQYWESSVPLDEGPARGDSLLTTRQHRRILALTHDLSGQPDKPEDLPGLMPDFTEGAPCSEITGEPRSKPRNFPN